MTAAVCEDLNAVSHAAAQGLRPPRAVWAQPPTMHDRPEALAYVTRTQPTHPEDTRSTAHDLSDWRGRTIQFGGRDGREDRARSAFPDAFAEFALAQGAYIARNLTQSYERDLHAPSEGKSEYASRRVPQDALFHTVATGVGRGRVSSQAVFTNAIMIVRYAAAKNRSSFG